jgi:[ribosomal protein S5]-alanine N-acetyltransferase
VRGRRESSLIGPRVMLRVLESRDYDAWREIRVRSRDWLEPWEPMPEPGSPDPVTDADAFRARCGAWERQRQFDTAYGFGLFLRDGTLVGEVSLGSVLRGPFQSSFIGYWIDEKHAGNGYVPEGVALLIRYGFDTLGLHRMEAAIVPRNDKSRRVAEKLGLRDEGTARRFLQIRGAWEDHVRYAITLEDWAARKRDLEREFLRERAPRR